MLTASLFNINVVSGRTEPEIQNQDVSPFVKLEKKIHNVEIEPSKSTDLVSEGSVILESKMKKIGGKKTKSKSVRISESPVIQIKPTSENSEGLKGKELNAFYKNEAKRDEK